MPCLPVTVSDELAAQINKLLPTSGRVRQAELANWLAEGLQARQRGIPIQLEIDWSRLTSGVHFKVTVDHKNRKERSDEKVAR